jgi:hypothetical protein
MAVDLLNDAWTPQRKPASLSQTHALEMMTRRGVHADDSTSKVADDEQSIAALLQLALGRRQSFRIDR